MFCIAALKVSIGSCHGGRTSRNWEGLFKEAMHRLRDAFFLCSRLKAAMLLRCIIFVKSSKLFMMRLLHTNPFQSRRMFLHASVTFYRPFLRKTLCKTLAPSWNLSTTSIWLFMRWTSFQMRAIELNGQKGVKTSLAARYATKMTTAFSLPKG